MQPLAILAYKRLMPGSLLANRLQDLQYRVHVVSDVTQLAALAQAERPMVILTDFDFEGTNICPTIRTLRQGSTTSHLPIIVFAPDDAGAAEGEVRTAGATLWCTYSGVQNHLAQLLERALSVE